jgi:hypothetical protein
MSKKILLILIIIISGYFLVKNNTYVYVINNIQENNKDFYNPNTPDYTDKQCSFHNKGNIYRRKTGSYIVNDITLYDIDPNLFDVTLSDGFTYNQPRTIEIDHRNYSSSSKQLANLDSWIIPNYPGKIYEGKNDKNAKYMFGTNYHIMHIAPAFCQEFKNIEEFKNFFSKINSLDYIILYSDFENEERTSYYLKILFTEGTILDIIEVVKKVKSEKRIRLIIFPREILNEYKDSEVYRKYLDRPIY